VHTLATRTHSLPARADRHAQVATLLQDWLGGLAATTVRAYSQDLQAWAGWMGQEPPRALDALVAMDSGTANGMAMAYRAHMRQQGLAPATINRRLAALRSVVSAARTAGLVSWDLSVRPLRAEAYRDTRGPGVDGYRAMQAVLHTDTLQGRRDCALLSLLYTMALRRAEVVGLDLEDVDLPGQRLWITGKGRTQKEAVSIPPQTQQVLQEWLEARGNAPGPVFVSMDRRLGGALERITLNAVTRRVREIGAQAGVHVTPHGLRHAGITRALDLTGGDVRRVRHLSRHVKLDTLMLYDDARTDLGGGVAALLAADA
jgi:integrase/recombinase XerC